MKEKYENPEVEIISIESEDVLTESGGGFDLEEDVL